MYGTFWIGSIQCGTKNQGNRHQKSIGSKPVSYCGTAFKKLFGHGDHCLTNCFTHSMVGYEQLAQRFSLPHQSELVGLCSGRVGGFTNCTDHSKLSVHQSSNIKSS